MKYLLATVFALLFAVAAGAQELTVKSLEASPMDVTAATHVVKDLNDKPCGLVKVWLAADGATFEGNIIGEVEHRTSQYFVYMTEGSYRLQVVCPGYLPLLINFRDYGVQKVMSKNTYVLTLLLPNVPSQTAASLSPAPSASSSRIASSATSPQSEAKVPVPEAVDLGLSVKWASFNLGASKPEEYGNYYKWGETTPADHKGDATYKYDNSIYDKEKNVLKPEHDAATVNLGGHWRMPTDAEIKELKDKCKQKWTKLNGKKGIRVTGPNGNTIFLPASGDRNLSNGSLHDVGYEGYYWSASPYSGSGGRYLYFYSGNWGLLSSIRAYGFPVRPVLAE